MANWALIENGVITEFHDVLPLNWRHVSNLRAAASDLAFLATLGWYPVIKNDQAFDPETQTVQDWQYEIRTDAVYATAVIVPRSEPTEPTPEDQRMMSDQELATIRSQLSRYESTMNQAALAKLAEDIAQQDQEWRKNLRESLATTLQSQVATQIATYLSQDQAFLGALTNQVAAAMGQYIRDSHMHVINAAIDREIIREYRSQESNMQATIVDTVREYRERFAVEHERLMQRHIDHLQGLINLEEIGDPIPRSELDRLRIQRNRLLLRSDWTQAPDVQASMTPEWQQRWQTYRQRLRDLPQQFEDNNGQIQWPLP
jgi:hypothetical protein